LQPGAGTGEKPPAPDVPGEKPGTGGAETPPPAKSAAEEGVLWTSGHVRLEVWRLRDGEKAAWAPEEPKLPAAGAAFVADRNIHKIRAAVTASNVAKIEVEEWVGPRGGPVTKLEPAKDGRLQLVERKDGARVVHYEVRLPDGNRAASMAIVLTFPDGTSTRDEFTFRRAEPKK
jgi:hypothetical protein